MAKPPEQWDQDEVARYLQEINLGALVPLLREHDIVGEDLICLTETELKEELNLTRLQARRIKRGLEDGGLGCQKHAEPEPELPPAAPSDVNGAVPHAEPPDLEDRDAMQANGGSFSRAVDMPAAPAVGIPVPAAEPAESLTSVDEATIRKYAETCELIARLEAEQVTVRLPSVREALSQLEKRLGSEERKFNELLEGQEKKQKKADELQDGKWYPGKYLFGKAKAKAKVEQAVEAAEQMSLKVHAAGAVLERMNRDKASLQAQLTELTTKTTQLRRARQWEEGILPQIFAGVAGDARENALEREVDGLLPKLQQARQYQTSYSNSFELMRSARKQLNQARELFQSAYGLATANLVGGVMRRGAMGGGGLGRDGPGGMMGNMANVAKRVQSRQAAELCQAACDAILKARAIIPATPHVELDKVRALRGLGLAGIVFDNVAFDAIARRKIQMAMQTVDQLCPQVLQAERWLEGWLGRVREDLRTTEQLYAQKKGELDAYRRDLMQKMVEAQAAAAVERRPHMYVATIGVPAAVGSPAAPVAGGAAAPTVAPAGQPVIPDLL